MKIEELQKKNPNINIYTVDNKIFKSYGRILKGSFVDNLVELAEANTEIPLEKNIYIAEEPAISNEEIKQYFSFLVFGGMDTQIGYCNGNNDRLGALEWHSTPEIDIALRDIVLLLGHWEDIEDNKYQSEKIKGFLLPAGTAVELYPRVLHFSPCKLSNSGFKSVIILPKGTNLPLSDRVKDIKPETLLMNNKWILAHPENTMQISRGAKIGIIGENYIINY